MIAALLGGVVVLLILQLVVLLRIIHTLKTPRSPYGPVS